MKAFDGSLPVLNHTEQSDRSAQGEALVNKPNKGEKPATTHAARGEQACGTCAINLTPRGKSFYSGDLCGLSFHPQVNKAMSLV